MNTFGNKFRVSIFGESHGPRIGVTVDGVLPGIPLSEADFVQDLSRRKAGALGTTPRLEADEPEIASGVYEGKTTGAPLTILFKNENTRSEDYEQFRKNPRPGHADFTTIPAAAAISAAGSPWAWSPPASSPRKCSISPSSTPS